MKSQLLCTFTTRKDLDDVVEDIKNSYEIFFNKIYILQNENNVEELICTYNVNKNMLMVTNSDGLNKINTRIFKIIKID